MLSVELEPCNSIKLLFDLYYDYMMKNTGIFTILCLILFVACQTPVDFSQPPEIIFGEDLCTECGMIISEPRFSAAYYTLDGDARHFDDVGGMATHYAENQDEVSQFWVHDYDSEDWINAEKAFFVMSDQIQTPMGFGVVAFSDQTRAQKLASGLNAMVMSFEEVIESFREGSSSHEHSDS